MSNLLRLMGLLALVLAIPIIPFLFAGDEIESLVAGWLSPPPSPSTIFWIVIAVLATDIFLPVPSSLVSTLAGVHLPLLVAILAS